MTNSNKALGINVAKCPKYKKSRAAQFWAKLRQSWLRLSLSFIVTLFMYSYYQTAIQAEVSFTLPLIIAGAQDRIVEPPEDGQEVTLHLAGRKHDLENLRSSDFETYVRLPAGKNGALQLPVYYRVRNNNVQLNKYVKADLEPKSVALNVERETSKELPIEVKIQGYPATGYSLGAYHIHPNRINVTGPSSALKQLDAISTKPIDITGKSQPFQQIIELEQPELANGNSPTNLRLAFKTAQVQIQIDARSETQTFALEPLLINLPSNLTLENILPNEVQLTLQSNRDILRDIEEGSYDIRIELDAGDIFTAGRYALPVMVNGLPQGISLLSITPNRVSVVIAANYK